MSLTISVKTESLNGLPLTDLLAAMGPYIQHHPVMDQIESIVFDDIKHGYAYYDVTLHTRTV